METKELIADFSARLGTSLELDDDGVCKFEADGLVVSIHDLPEVGAVALIGDLGEPPPESLEGLYAALLDANHLFSDTGGATLSRNPETNRIALCLALHRKMLDADSFFGAVERFISAAHVWADVVSNYRGETSVTESIPKNIWGAGLFV